jgi:TRAP-type C4-dicarboxylate transport system substrate-binding protein
VARIVAVAVLALAGALATADRPAAQEIKLKLAHVLPASHHHHQAVILPWVEEVRKRTGGRVDITVFPGASLCPTSKQYECVRDGIADLAWAPAGPGPGRAPMTSVIELPFLLRSATAGAQILADLWERYLKKEYEDTQVLYLNVSPAAHLHTQSRPVRALEDLKGMRLAAPTAVGADLLEMLGAVKVGMSPHAMYEAMSQRGADGFGMPFEALAPFRLHEVVRYHTEIGLYAAAFALHANRKKYAALPPEARRVLDETTAVAGGYWRRVGEAWDRAEAAARRALADGKVEIHVVPREERRRWREAARALDDRWAADLDKRGLPGKALLRDARDLSARYGESE